MKTVKIVFAAYNFYRVIRNTKHQQSLSVIMFLFILDYFIRGEQHEVIVKDYGTQTPDYFQYKVSNLIKLLLLYKITYFV